MYSQLESWVDNNRYPACISFWSFLVSSSIFNPFCCKSFHGSLPRLVCCICTTKCTHHKLVLSLRPGTKKSWYILLDLKQCSMLRVLFSCSCLICHLLVSVGRFKDVFVAMTSFFLIIWYWTFFLVSLFSVDLRTFHPQLEVATHNGKIVTCLYLYCNNSCFLNAFASNICLEAHSLVKPAEYLHFH